MTMLPGLNTASGTNTPKIHKPRRHLIRMLVFLAVVIGISVFLFGPAKTAFIANPYLNGLIFAVLFFGIGFIFRQVFMLNQEIDWVENLKKIEAGVSLQSSPVLLSPLATIIRENNGPLRLSAMSMNTLLDSISARLEEGRDISRYLINVLIFLGLLGTFWGLLETVSSVGAAISTLNVGDGDFIAIFDELKNGLQRPLDGMAVAFSSSLFGLSGSLVLGFLDMQAGQAQNRFYADLEEWLTSITRFSSSGPTSISDGDHHSVPAYVSALLEQTAESLDGLQRTLSRNEERRHSGENAMNLVSEKLAALTDQMRSEQDLMVKLVEGQLELKPVLQRMAQVQEQGGLDQASRNHLRNLDVYVARLLEDVADGRNQITQEIRSDIKLLTRTIAAIAEEDRRS